MRDSGKTLPRNMRMKGVNERTIRKPKSTHRMVGQFAHGFLLRFFIARERVTLT